jgi:hypothetical protein
MYVSILLDFTGAIAYPAGHENTTNTIWIAAGGGVSADFDCGNGALFLAGTAISATRLRMSDDRADGLAAGSDPADRLGLGVFIFS